MRYKQASVDLVCNYIRYVGKFRALRKELRQLPEDAYLEPMLHETLWKGRQFLMTIEIPRRRRDESDEELLSRCEQRRSWMGDGDNLQSERAMRARERRR